MFNINSATQVVRDAIHSQTGIFLEDIGQDDYENVTVEITSLDFSHLFPTTVTGYTNHTRNQVSIFMHGHLNFPNIHVMHVGFTPEQGDIYNIVPA